MGQILNVGDDVEKIMAVSKKVVRTFSGGEFFLFQFTDKDGVLKGVMWDPPSGSDNIRAGDVVRVSGTIQDYKGSIQIKVYDIEKLESAQYDPAMFLPSSSKPVDEIYSEIQRIISAIDNKYLKLLLEKIFDNESFRERLISAPAAKGWHHAYIGGLVEHIYDMLQIAVKAAGIYPQIDEDLLISGVILHDLGKLQELKVTNHIEYSDRGRLLGHITLGVEFLNEYIRGIEGFPDDLEMKIKHMILSHHGKLEHGSPVRPMMVEALLLSYIDNMDAQVRGTLNIFEDHNKEDGNWTEYVRLLDRFFYYDNEETD
ncbi:MAG TPA: HD domain-containing protein [Candidatus Krumholzibacteriaceae bacterium]|nr:HD domain-containing protein [Candidatus Krumholzibacteriaceae bacterium]